MQDGTSFDVELQLITAAGRRVWVRVIGEAERNAVGVIRVQGAMQDISERKKTEQALRGFVTRYLLDLKSAGVPIVPSAITAPGERWVPPGTAQLSPARTSTLRPAMVRRTRPLTR